MKYIKQQLNVMKAVGFVTYKEWAAYRTHSMVSILVGPLYFCVQIFIWNAVYSTQTSVAGMDLQQMILYFAIVTVIHYLTMDFADWNLQMLIHTGKFVTYLLRPLNHSYFAFSQKIGHRVLGLLYEFIPVTIIVTLLFKINLAPASIGWTIISIALSFVMMFCINYCIGITAFWLTRTGGLRSVFLVLRNVFSGAFIPLVLFPGMVQKILFFLPFQFVAYVPARVWLGNYDLAGISMPIEHIVLIQAGYTLMMFIFMQLLYRFGIKKFTGVGT